MQLNKCFILTSMDKTIIQDRNYYNSPQSFPNSPSPECSSNPAGKKTIFCLCRRATKGSSLCAVAKKFCAEELSWTRAKRTGEAMPTRAKRTGGAIGSKKKSRNIAASGFNIFKMFSDYPLITLLEITIF